MEIGEPSQGGRVNAVLLPEGASFSGILMGPAGALRSWPFMVRRNGRPVEPSGLGGGKSINTFRDGAWRTNEIGEYGFTNMPGGYYEMLVLLAGGRVQAATREPPLAENGVRGERPGLSWKSCAPEAEHVWIEGIHGRLAMERIPGSDLFQWRGATAQVSERYQLHWEDRQGHLHSRYDPYAFPPLVGDFDLYLYGEGKHRRPYNFLGANRATYEGISGILFAVWAPNAVRVSVVGDFNRWDGRCHPLRSRGNSGIWELFIPGLPGGTLYKFELRLRDGLLRGCLQRALEAWRFDPFPGQRPTVSLAFGIGK